MVTVAPTHAMVDGVLKSFDQFHLDDTPKQSHAIAVPNAEMVDALFLPAISLRDSREQRVADGASKLSSQAKLSPLRPHNSLSDSLNDLFVLETSPRVIYKPGVETAKRSCAAYNVLCLNGLSDVAPCTKEGKIPQYISRRDLEVSYKIRKDILKQDFVVDPKLVFVLEAVEDQFFEYEDGCYSWQLVDGSMNLCRLVRKKTKLDDFLNEVFIILQSNQGTSYLAPQKGCLRLHDAKESFHITQSDVDGEYCLKPKSLRGYFSEEKYVKMLHQIESESDEELLVSKALLIPYVKETILYGNQLYSVSEGDGGLQIAPVLSPLDDLLDEPFVLLKKTAKKIEVVPHSGCDQLFEVEQERYVLRDSLQFFLEPANGANDGYRLVAKNVAGVFQEKIHNIFTGENGKVLDIGNSGPTRDTFYAQICQKSFIRAFVAMILLRHEDGKIASLDQSNFLFERLSDGKLRPIMIDLDDALPETNGLKEDGTHRIRNGLMAFPQARKVLEAEQRLNLVQLIEKIGQQAQASRELLQQTLGQKHAASYQHIVNKLSEIQESLPNTLEELFFALFPDYKAHWEAFSKVYSQPEEIALFVGERAPSHIRV